MIRPPSGVGRSTTLSQRAGKAFDGRAQAPLGRLYAILGLFALGDVEHDTAEMSRLVVGVIGETAAHFDPDGRL